ncbi:MAG: spermine/spermidine synthase domain-containing protein [Planctomycetota bacterium]|jgi:spermidine synthase
MENAGAGTRSQESSARHAAHDASHAPLPPLLLGFNAQVIQLILFREALVLSSGSEAALGLCLGAWAFFNGLGALAGWICLKLRLSLGRFFALLLACMPLLLALSVHLSRVCRAWIDVPPGEHLRLGVFSLLAVVVLAPATFLDGLLFLSALERLFGKKAGGSGTSFVYGMESMGSLAGGLLFSFLLVAFADPFTVAGLLLCLNSLFLPLSGVRPLIRPRGLRSGVRLVLFCAGCLALVFGPSINKASDSLRWHILQPGLEWIESRETRYQNLAVLKYGHEFSIFGNTHLLFTLRPRSPADSGDWELGVFPHFAMLQNVGARSVLLIGGGSKGFLNDLLEYEPSRLDWVDFDRVLVELSAQYQHPEERLAWQASEVVYHETDGRYFIKTSAPESYDLILVDVPDPANANLNRYYSLDFFQECRRALRNEGILVISMSCQPNFLGDAMKQRNGSVYAALREVFPSVVVTPGTFSFLAAGGAETAPSADPETLIQRFEAKGMQTDRFSPLLFYTFFEEDDLAWINKLFREGREAGEFIPNEDDRPVAYFSDYLLTSAILGEPGEKGLWGAWEDFLAGHDAGYDSSRPFAVLLVLPGLGLILLLLAMRKRGADVSAARRGLLFLTAFTTGFSGISLEVAVLFAFQNGSGYLYSQMGVIIALYMAGLALGALQTGIASKAHSCFLASLVFMALGLGAALALLPLLNRLIPGEFFTLLFYGITILLLGASGGLSFRGVSLALAGLGTPGGGMIYFMDIVGTSLGGLLVGSSLIPSLGIRWTLVAAGGIGMILCLFALFSLIPTRASSP